MSEKKVYKKQEIENAGSGTIATDGAIASGEGGTVITGNVGGNLTINNHQQVIAPPEDQAIYHRPTPAVNRSSNTCGLVALAIFVIVLIAAFGGITSIYAGFIAPTLQQFCSSWGNSPNPPPWCTPEPSKPTFVTLENFNRVQFGMTYDQVSAILGEGAMAASSDLGMTVYEWKGPSFGQHISITFRNGVVSDKFQFNLK